MCLVVRLEQAENQVTVQRTTIKLCFSTAVKIAKAYQTNQKKSLENVSHHFYGALIATTIIYTVYGAVNCEIRSNKMLFNKVAGQ